MIHLWLHGNLFAAAEAEETAEGIAALGIDPIAIILQAGTFLVLFFFLKKFGLSKIVANLKDRRDTIEEGLKNAHDIELQKAKLEEENREIALQARKEADIVINKSHEEAGAIILEAQTKAAHQAAEIIKKAEAQASEQLESARKELKSEILGLVAEASENVLLEKLDAESDKKLIKKSLASVEASS